MPIRWLASTPNLINQTTPTAALDVLHHQHAEEGSGHSGHYSVAPTGISAEPMRVQWSPDTACLRHKKCIYHAIVWALAPPTFNFNSYMYIHDGVRLCQSIAVLTTDTKVCRTEFCAKTRRVLFLRTGSGKSLCCWLLQSSVSIRASKRYCLLHCDRCYSSRRFDEKPRAISSGTRWKKAIKVGVDVAARYGNNNQSLHILHMT